MLLLVLSLIPVHDALSTRTGWVKISNQSNCVVLTDIMLIFSKIVYVSLKRL